MNSRIKKLRKYLKMNQSEFGKKLGIKQSAVTAYETNVRNPSESVVLAIIREFNVNEKWLREGIEPMFTESTTFSLDEFIKKHGASDLELEIMKAYFELDQDIRKKVVEHFKSRLSNPAATDTTKETLEEKINREAEQFKRERLLEEKIQMSSASLDLKEKRA